MMKKQKHAQKTFSTCIVVGPMPFSWKTLKTSLKVPETQLFFIDGGLIHRKKFEKSAPLLLKNAQSLGDGDSSQKPMSIMKTDQNLSDLAYFFKFIKKNKAIKNFLLVGFLGGRLDHQLFNLGEIYQFLEKIPAKNAPKILLDDKIEFLSAGVHQINICGKFSLGSLKSCKIKISGACEYQSNKWIELSTLSSRGLSNHGSGLIKFESTEPLMILY